MEFRAVTALQLQDIGEAVKATRHQPFGRAMDVIVPVVRRIVAETETKLVRSEHGRITCEAMVRDYRRAIQGCDKL
jgi:hypothetical protein